MWPSSTRITRPFGPAAGGLDSVAMGDRVAALAQRVLTLKNTLERACPRGVVGQTSMSAGVHLSHSVGSRPSPRRYTTPAGAHTHPL